jgi:HAD superfamily hydrolase (TIGR01509 family)
MAYVLALATLVVVSTACETDVDVAVDVAEDGSGQVGVTVVLDREAAGQLLDLEDEGLRLDDLFRSGWEIQPPESTEDGSVQTTAIKQFGTPEQFAEIMNELSGSGGLFSDFELTRTKAFARVEYQIDGSLRPAGLDAFSDPELDAALGRMVSEIAGATYGATGGDVRVSLVVRMPGTVDPVVSTGVVDLTAGDQAVRTWTTTLDGSAVDVVINSTTQEVQALVWRGVSIVAAVLAVLVMFGHLLRLLRPERRRGRGGTARSSPRASKNKPASDKPVSKKPATSTPAGEDAGDEIPENPTVVALDGMGVLYREGDDINRILVPFVRERGSEVTHDEIVARARSISLGRITPTDFWTAVGVAGDPNEIDEDYLSRFQLNPGVVKFLRSLRARGVRVACITNDSTTWATKLRVRHSLEKLIDPWVVSGAVGVRKPDGPIYEVLRRVTGEDPSLIMIIDDNLDNLDAARSFGFRTAWFAPEGLAEEARHHAILRSFDVGADEDGPA